MSPVAVLIPAAGLSSRFGSNKLHATLLGQSVLLRTVRAFLSHPATANIVLATPVGRPPRDTLPADLLAILDEYPRIRLVEGGPTRAHSVRRALEASMDLDWVAVHDAARPLVSLDLIDRLYEHADTHGTAVPALPVKLTVKEARGPLPAPVFRTLPRADLWEMQTPQVIRRVNLVAAYARCWQSLETITDDAQLLEVAGQRVWLVPGEERNLKLTTAADLHLAERLLGEGAA
ncbi:MAG TPA: 2-C-methyl-D-erythritol 4-phosphate cytidylyltransferase [Tepidisphaeraceae bacterium]|jgi:2-C-methyl-D-erythritol 4-phosphate cytidylyltransferase